MNSQHVYCNYSEKNTQYINEYVKIPKVFKFHVMDSKEKIMKNIKKIVAAGLVLSMSLSMAGCMGGGKLAPSKLAASAKKNGCELYKDADDFADDIEEDDDIEDGIYITVSGSDVKDILKTNDFREQRSR